MKNIITIQHTQSVHHTNDMVGSWTDWDLSDLGRAQADNIGRNLEELVGEAKFVLYSSDLKRAKQTAEAVGKYLGLTPILRTELRERNLGKCCGKSVQWLTGCFPTPKAAGMPGIGCSLFLMKLWKMTRKTSSLCLTVTF